MANNSNYPSEYSVIFESLDSETEVDTSLVEASRDVALIRQLSDALEGRNSSLPTDTYFDTTATFELSFVSPRRRV